MFKEISELINNIGIMVKHGIHRVDVPDGPHPNVPTPGAKIIVRLDEKEKGNRKKIYVKW